MENQPGEAAQGLNISSSGQLILKPVQPAKSINTISDWSDAFLVYASIFLAAHPHRIQELLKYMNTIRTAARRHAGMGWKAYDQQFRLRFAADPTGIRFDRIDYELWLLFVGPSNHYGAFTERVQTKKSYDFNFNRCTRVQCPYRHICLNCGGNHPANICRSHFNRMQFQESKTFRPNRVSAPQGQRFAGPRFEARPRYTPPNV